MNATSRLASAALTALAVTAAAAGARAADLPARLPPAPYVAPAAPLPAFTWAGAHFGVNAGASFDDATVFGLRAATDRDDGIGNSRPGSFRNSDDGFTAGAQVGYDYEFRGLGAFGLGAGGMILGFETDANYVDSASTGSYLGTSRTGNPAQNMFRSGLDYLGTVRGRVGLAFDRFMVYGTGGFAYGDTFQKAAFQTAGDAAQLRYYGSRSGFQTGVAYGGGVEYALPTDSFLNFMRSSAVTMRLEYLHYDLGDANLLASNRVVTGTGSAYALRTSTDGDIGRVGLNYKF